MELAFVQYIQFEQEQQCQLCKKRFFAIFPATDGQLMNNPKISRNTFYKYKKEIKAE